MNICIHKYAALLPPDVGPQSAQMPQYGPPAGVPASPMYGPNATQISPMTGYPQINFASTPAQSFCGQQQQYLAQQVRGYLFYMRPPLC